MFIEWFEGNALPQSNISSVRKLGIMTFRIVVDPQQINEKDEEPRYRWGVVELTPGLPKLGEIIAAIVRSRYSADDIEGINNNYIYDGDTNKEHYDEWAEMQKWRQTAKSYAKELLKEMESIW